MLITFQSRVIISPHLGWSPACAHWLRQSVYHSPVHELPWIQVHQVSDFPLASLIFKGPLQPAICLLNTVGGGWQMVIWALQWNDNGCLSRCYDSWCLALTPCPQAMVSSWEPPLKLLRQASTEFLWSTCLPWGLCFPPCLKFLGSPALHLHSRKNMEVLCVLGRELLVWRDYGGSW